VPLKTFTSSYSLPSAPAWQFVIPKHHNIIDFCKLSSRKFKKKMVTTQNCFGLLTETDESLQLHILELALTSICQVLPSPTSSAEVKAGLPVR
jgi:hypothetical protein